MTLVSCTSNQMARVYGGNSTINLTPGEKLINITWKGADVWYLTRHMQPSDSVETYTFIEASNFGLMEGTVTIKESR